MPVKISYIADENLAILIFQGNLDMSSSQDISAICRNLSSCVKSCTIDLSAVERLFDSGLVLLQELCMRLSEHRIKTLILSDHAASRRLAPDITCMPTNVSLLRRPGQSDFSPSV